MSVLVIGYGNELRGDDGVGPAVARELARRGVRSLAVHQLTPELAAELAAASVAVFVDARVGGEAVQITTLEPDTQRVASGHVADPRGLLALAREVYGRAPAAWLVTVAGEDFGLGEGLTRSAAANVACAIQSVEELVRPAKRRPRVRWGD